MKQKDIKQVIALYHEGYNAEDIAIETDLLQEDIEACIEEYEEEQAPTLSGIDKANALKEKELEMSERKAFVDNEKAKRGILKKFIGTIEGLQDHVQGSSWASDSIRKMYKEIDSLVEEVMEAFYFDKEAMADNSIFEILVILKLEFSNLAKNDPDYKITIDWSDEKIEMLEYALVIEEFDDTEFDTEDFNYRKALGAFTRLIDDIVELQDERMNSEAIEDLESSIQFTIETLESDTSGVEGNFEDQIDLLNEILEHLKEFAIRVDESIWGEKRLSLPEAITERIDELEEAIED